jgi:peptidoglycan/LPS O-acetylase OafA/YrhL
MDTSKRRLYELDVLRGLAALAVVLYHYTHRYDQLFVHQKSDYYSFSYGYFGVQLFFLISGFVIFMTLTKCKDSKEFIGKRAVRLFPAYITAVVLTFILVSAFGLKNREVSFTEALLNLTMIKDFIFDKHIPYVDGAYWSLTVEIAFYLLMGLILLLGIKKKVEVFSLLWVGVSSLLMLNIEANNQLYSTLRLFLFPQYSHLFIAGIMFYLIKERGRLIHHFMLLVCIIYEYIFFGDISNIFVTLFYILFYLLIFEKLKFLITKPLIFLGSISYSLYLIHQNIGYIIINKMESFGLVSEYFLVIPIGITVGLASLITFYIERPAQELILSKKIKWTVTQRSI